MAILNDLHKEDHFALVIFDTDILTWKDTLVKATAGNVSKAITYVKKIKDRGGQRKAFIFLSFVFIFLPSPFLPFFSGNKGGKLLLTNCFADILLPPMSFIFIMITYDC